MNATDLQRPLRVAIVAGGVATLRGESLASGRAMALAFAQLGHQATVVDAGQMPFEQIEWSGYDVCCPTVPGMPAWQARWEQLGIPYVGGELASVETTASRSATRQTFLRFDVPTPGFVALRRSVSPVEAAARVASLGFPLLMRPDQLSAGLQARFVRDADELSVASRELFAIDDRVLCERFLPGREFAVTLLGERALPPIELPSPDEAACTACDRSLTAEEVFTLEHAALLATAAVGITGLAQVQLVLDGRGRAWVLEVHAAPNLAENSPAVRGAQQAGMSLCDLCQWMLADSLVQVGRATHSVSV